MKKQTACSGLQETTGSYDLIFIDPPTFSNTKKENRVFDVQKDHVRLIELAMAHLEPDGLLIFSTNYRRFTLEERLLTLYDIRDISRESVPFDFSRNEKIHQCWEIRQTGQSGQIKKWPEKGPW